MSRLPLRTRFLGHLLAVATTPAWKQSADEIQRGRSEVPAEPLASMILGRKLDMADITDTTYEGPAGDMPARIYTPQECEDAAIMYIHGGGFVTNSIETYDRQCRRLAHVTRARVVSVDYRMAPQHVFPAAFEDAIAALSWFQGFDAKRHYVMGDSAGGNLSAGVCIHAANQGAWMPDGQILLYPVTDMSRWHASVDQHPNRPILPRKLLEFYHKTYAPTPEFRQDPRASPLLAPELGGQPRALVYTAAFDPLHDEGVAYVRRLQEANVDVDWIDVQDTCHGFFTFPGWCTHVKESLERVRDFVKGGM